MNGLPAGADTFVRNIGYYNPSDNLVIYHHDLGSCTGIVRLSQFDCSMEAIT